MNISGMDSICAQIKHLNGQDKLTGWFNNDETVAFDWASLFAHELVFMHSHCPCRTRKSIAFSSVLDWGVNSSAKWMPQGD